EAAEERSGEEEAGVSLTKDDIKTSLKGLSKTIDGSGYAFTIAELPGRGLTDIKELQGYVHLRYVNLSGNLITELDALSEMNHLLSIDLSNNRLENVKLPALEFLQILDLSRNRIKEIQELAFPMLTKLILSQNQIESIGKLDGNPNLKHLDLVENQLTSCEGLGVSSLEQLKLRANKVTGLKGLENVVHVTELDMSENAIESLAGLNPEGKLKTLIVANNQIPTMEALEALGALKLENLDVRENPMMENFEKPKLIKTIPSLSSLNGEPLTAEEKEAA
ncbi:hypothetical protein GUITHDRAFT_44957, partial [Guillardia theta CCMP2712]